MTVVSLYASRDAKIVKAKEIDNSKGRFSDLIRVKDRLVVRPSVSEVKHAQEEHVVITASYIAVFVCPCSPCAGSLYSGCLIKTLSESNQCCHLMLNRCAEQRRGGDYCRPKVHLRGRREHRCCLS